MPLPEPPPLPPVSLTEEALGQFATRVQPILMNTCAGCHANGKGGAFRLARTYDATLLDRKAVQYNVAAVLAQVKPDQPLTSPLLAKSISVHGDLNQSPLKNRQAAAYRTLEEWVRRTVSDNPQLASAQGPAGNSPGPASNQNAELSRPSAVPMPPAPTTAIQRTAASSAEPARPLPGRGTNRLRRLRKSRPTRLTPPTSTAWPFRSGLQNPEKRR